MLSLHRHKWGHHSPHTQLLRIPAEYSTEQRRSNLFNNFLAKVPPDKRGYTLVFVRGRSLQFLGPLQFPMKAKLCLIAKKF